MKTLTIFFGISKQGNYILPLRCFFTIYCTRLNFSHQSLYFFFALQHVPALAVEVLFPVVLHMYSGLVRVSKVCVSVRVRVCEYPLPYVTSALHIDHWERCPSLVPPNPVAFISLCTQLSMQSCDAAPEKLPL